ncbi:MAG: UDP-N-acetylglucosamine acyltransferase [Planctomycetota bacterium]|jgi:UDP-N-acetylglucosamine acyltransferase
MQTQIHPTAIVDPLAELDTGVQVGPFAIIESGAQVGSGCNIMARAHIMSSCRMGENNQVHPGVVLGNNPQDKSFRAEISSFLEIGNDNIFREHACIHRASTEGSSTKIGNRGFFMVNSHAAHDVVIGDDVIICNNTVLAGYVSVGDGAFISGNVVVHQFTRIGALCMLGGSSAAGQDAPPFTTVIGRSQIRGLNNIGMKRAGIDGRTRVAIKQLYNKIFACRGSLKDVLALFAEPFGQVELDLIRSFYLTQSKRGFMWPPVKSEARHDERLRPEKKT